MIYLDTAATSFMKPPCVERAVVQAFGELGSCGRGAGGPALQASRTAYQLRKCLSELLGADGPQQVAFTLNATHALNQAIDALVGAGDHVVSSVQEHNSVLRPLHRKIGELGTRVTIVPCDADGRVHEKDILYAVTPDTRAVVLTHASNLTGHVLDIERIGHALKHTDTLFIVDAAQSAGVIPIDMKRMGIDVLCFSGHKGLMGPQGTGAICVREGLRLRPLTVGGTGIKTFSTDQPGDMPELLESGTLNVHGLAGLLAGVRYVMDTGVSVIHQKQTALEQAFYDRICDLPIIKIYGCRDVERTATIAFALGDMDSARVCDELSTRYGIITRAGGHCAPLLHEALGTAHGGLVRASFSPFNTLEEIALAAEAVRHIAREGL